ncbi:hypothetical protein C8R43DRAFT_386889 [Mycena crocata]|nr:hypothetical protein C8R43DRAFT_386889 [Mycena crocata]
MTYFLCVPCPMLVLCIFSEPYSLFKLLREKIWEKILEKVETLTRIGVDYNTHRSRPVLPFFLPPVLTDTSRRPPVFSRNPPQSSIQHYPLPRLKRAPRRETVVLLDCQSGSILVLCFSVYSCRTS